ncbi:MAG: hypothetical protein NTY02_14055 [Acidobacteria bacterium]|nr:hypothetical protein [Acidobacteriota bacterium]
MTTGYVGALAGAGLCIWMLAASASPASAESAAKGTLVVNGMPVEITQAYAYTQKGFFDEKKLDVVVLLCDAAVPDAAVRDVFARNSLITSGTLHCVELVINADRQIISFRVQHQRFGQRPPGGGSTEHVFDAKTFDGKTAAGRAHTTSTQMSFDDVPYSYDITFNAAVASGR